MSSKTFTLSENQDSFLEARSALPVIEADLTRSEAQVLPEPKAEVFATHWILHQPPSLKTVDDMVEAAAQVCDLRNAEGHCLEAPDRMGVLEQIGFIDEKEPTSIFEMARSVFRFNKAAVAYSIRKRNEVSEIRNSHRPRYRK